MKSFYLRRTVTASIVSIVCSICSFATGQAAIITPTEPQVVLSHYQADLISGDTFTLSAFSTDRKTPAFQSSNSRIASVNTQGRITAKASGTCRITAKVKNAKASCRIKVTKATLSLSRKSISLEHGETYQLQVSGSSAADLKYSSNKKKVAVVDSNGCITACAPGDAVITVRSGTRKVTCKVKVKRPTIRLNHMYVSLYRNQTSQLTADVSSGLTPVWKSNRSRVATVNENGLIVAHKHGTAIITAKVDGVSKICEVVVKSPTIRLETTSLTMTAGQQRTLDYSVSSGNPPTITSSKPHVVAVDALGNLTALAPGKAILSFTEDGARETCSVEVLPAA